MDATCGSKIPSDIISISNKATVEFKTDSSGTKSGWRLQYSHLPGCVVLDTDTENWVPGLGQLDRPRFHSTVISSSLGVYIIGGIGESSIHSSEFLPYNSQSWETGPDLQIPMDFGCAVSISSTAFMIISKKDIRVFDASFYPENPTSNLNWMDQAVWPKLKTERWYHPGCALTEVGERKIVIIAGGSRSPLSTFSTGSSSGSSSVSSSGSSGSSQVSSLAWCSPRCDVRRNRECCYNPSCYTEKLCQWINYFRGKILDRSVPYIVAFAAFPPLKYFSQLTSLICLEITRYTKHRLSKKKSAN